MTFGWLKKKLYVHSLDKYYSNVTSYHSMLKEWHIQEIQYRTKHRKKYNYITFDLFHIVLLK
jgi:hypothetical protein